MVGDQEKTQPKTGARTKATKATKATNTCRNHFFSFHTPPLLLVLCPHLGIGLDLPDLLRFNHHHQPFHISYLSVSLRMDFVGHSLHVFNHLSHTVHCCPSDHQWHTTQHFVLLRAFRHDGRIGYFCQCDFQLFVALQHHLFVRFLGIVLDWMMFCTCGQY